MNDFEIKERLAPCGLHCGTCFAFHDGEIHNAAVRLQRHLGNFAPYAQRFAVQLDPVFEQYPAFAVLLDYLADSSWLKNVNFTKTVKSAPVLWRSR